MRITPVVVVAALRQTRGALIAKCEQRAARPLAVPTGEGASRE